MLKNGNQVGSCFYNMISLPPNTFFPIVVSKFLFTFFVFYQLKFLFKNNCRFICSCLKIIEILCTLFPMVTYTKLQYSITIRMLILVYNPPAFFRFPRIYLYCCVFISTLLPRNKTDPHWFSCCIFNNITDVFSNIYFSG